jgi:hypothetical protein
VHGPEFSEEPALQASLEQKAKEIKELREVTRTVSEKRDD